MTEFPVPSPSFFEKLTNAIHLDYVLKIAGVGNVDSHSPKTFREFSAIIA